MKARISVHRDFKIADIDDRVYSAFLEHLEDERKNAAVTRNVRLAAIKSVLSLPRVPAAGRIV